MLHMMQPGFHGNTPAWIATFTVPCIQQPRAQGGGRCHTTLRLRSATSSRLAAPAPVDPARRCHVGCGRAVVRTLFAPSEVGACGIASNSEFPGTISKSLPGPVGSLLLTKSLKVSTMSGWKRPQSSARLSLERSTRRALLALRLLKENMLAFFAFCSSTPRYCTLQMLCMSDWERCATLDHFS